METNLAVILQPGAALVSRSNGKPKAILGIPAIFQRQLCTLKRICVFFVVHEQIMMRLQFVHVRRSTDKEISCKKRPGKNLKEPRISYGLEDFLQLLKRKAATEQSRSTLHAAQHT